MPYNATTWTEKSNPSWQARFGLVGTAAMHDLYVIQGPNVTRDAREKIAFFEFHAFMVKDSRFQQNQVRTKRYNSSACICKSNVEIRIAGSFCRPQWSVVLLILFPLLVILSLHFLAKKSIFISIFCGKDKFSGKMPLKCLNNAQCFCLTKVLKKC